MRERENKYFESGQFDILNYSANKFDIEMDVHQSPTIALNRLHSLDTINALPIPKKRKGPQEDYRHLQTIRKKIHTNEDNDSNAETVKKSSPFDRQANNKPIDKSFYAQSISAMPLRQKYASLIPDFQVAQYNLDQKMLLRIQGRLDEHLLYLKVHRGKKKGEFFKSLRKNLIQGSQILMELQQLKQILFIDKSIYLYSREKDKDQSLDILLDLPPNPDLNQRKIRFKEQLYHYLLSQNAFDKTRRKYIAIPLFKFPFEEEIEYQNSLLLSKREEELLQSQQEQAKQQSESITLPKNVFSRSFNFKEKLFTLIKQREEQIKQRQALGLDKKYGKEQVLKVVDQIYLFYTCKAVCNMFKVTLTQHLTKKLLILDNIVSEIIDFITKGDFGYLRRIDHNKGTILQIEVKNYRSLREKIKEMSF